MQLVLLRHGQTDWNIEKRMQGCKDVPLNAHGMRQMEEVSRFFMPNPVYEFDQMISSPLLRAWQSAMICRSILGIPLEPDAEFSERSFGILEGHTHDEIERRWHIVDAEAVEASLLGIEDKASVHKRVSQGLARLRNRYDQKSVLLVTHGSIIRHIAMQNGMDVGIVRNGEYLVLENPMTQ